MVVIQLPEDFLGDQSPYGVAVKSLVAFEELIELECPVVVGVKEQEDLIQLSLLLATGQMVVDVGVSGSLKVVLQLQLFQPV